MATEDKASSKITQLKGKLKKKAGQATGDRSLEAEGRADETRGDLNQAGEKIKDAFRE